MLIFNFKTVVELLEVCGLGEANVAKMSKKILKIDVTEGLESLPSGVNRYEEFNGDAYF